MKCEDIQRQITECEPPLPDDIARHLTVCNECRSFAEADRRVRSWLRLKARECPSPDALDRVARKVQMAITATQPAPLWRLWFEETGLPWIARAAALVVVILGMSILWRTSMHTASRLSNAPSPALFPPAVDTSLPPARGFHLDSRLALQPEPITNTIHPMIRLAPGNEIEYGALRTRLVNWEK